MIDIDWINFLNDCERRAWEVTTQHKKHAGKRSWRTKARVIVKIANSNQYDRVGFNWWSVYDRLNSKVLNRGKAANREEARRIAEEFRDQWVEKNCPKGNVL